jgi:hypothetical protein
MPHSILMMHHPSGAARGQASEMHIESRELVRMRDYLSLLVSDHTGQPYDRVGGGLQGRRGVGWGEGPRGRMRDYLSLLVSDHTGQPGLGFGRRRGRPPSAHAAAPAAGAQPALSRPRATLTRPSPPPPTPPPHPPKVIRELSRNKWMNPKEAIEYGMIDKVLTTPMPKMPGLNRPTVKFSRQEEGEQDIGV